MRVRFGRREVIGVGTIAATALLVAVSFGPIVRGRVAAEAVRRRLEVKVGGVRPGWFAVRLLDLRLQPRGFPSMRAHVAEARIELSALLRVQRVELRGGEVVLDGTPESLRDDWRQWSGEHDEIAERTGRRPSLEATGMSVRWVDRESPELGAELRGLTGLRDSHGTRVAMTDGHARFGRAGIDMSEAVAEMDPKGMLVRAHATAVTVGWTANPDSAQPAGGPSANDPLPSKSPPTVIARAARSGRRARSTPPPPEDAGAPLVPLPDLHAVRAATAALSLALAQRVKEGADVGVDSLTWRITQDPDRVALTFGPGPLSFTRPGSQLELGYSTDKGGASTRLALRALLPTDGSDVVLTAEGGPVSLSLLGVKEGAAGLVDVERATVAGWVRVVLAGDGSALTFDVDAGTRGLSISDQKLALDAVRGLEIALRARGVVTAGGEVRFDDFAAMLGALHVSGSGSLNQTPDHVAGTAHLEVPVATCQSLLDSLPTALLPTLRGARLTGTFGARGRFAFDTRSLDDLELVYDVQDRCRLVQVPATLDRERFVQPFAYRIYLPDGSTTEQMSGPGTPNWTSLDHISPYMQTAVLTTEDGAFPKHHGYNHAAIRASIIANLKARRFVRGASTITMQLAKNLFLAREKTLSRKLEEVLLTDYLEQTFSKDELLELYLNVIEFGPDVYGVTSAADYYFGRTPAELDLAECLFLSSLLPAPLRYSAMRDGEQPPEGWMRTLHTLMEVARKRGLLTDAELSDGENEQVVFWHGGPRPTPRVAVRAHTPTGGDATDIPDPFEVGY
jgi:hypothetical protein